jgi:hypothetical protein
MSARLLGLALVVTMVGVAAIEAAQAETSCCSLHG